MPLALHLSIHLFFALLCGYLAGSYFKRLELCLIAGIMAGFLIDLDHVLEYFLVFGFNFNLQYFFEGRQFLTSGRNLLLFHAWEYAPLFLLAGFWLRSKKAALAAFLITFALAGSLHLISDCFINGFAPRFYSLSYRVSRGFWAEQLLPAADLERNRALKLELGI